MPWIMLLDGSLEVIDDRPSPKFDPTSESARLPRKKGDRLHRMRIYRVDEAGVRVPWVMELDTGQEVVSEAPVTPSRPEVAVARASQNVVDTPDRRKQIATSKWQTESIAENPIPGTDDLRASYFQDLEKLQASYDGECPACEIGRLMRSYKEILEERGHLKQFE